MKEKVLNELRFIIDSDQRHLDRVRTIEEYFLSLLKPKNFDGNSPNNVIIQQKVAFEKLCVSMMQSGITKPSKMSVLRFYAAIEYFETKSNKNGLTN